MKPLLLSILMSLLLISPAFIANTQPNENAVMQLKNDTRLYGKKSYEKLFGQDNQARLPKDNGLDMVTIVSIVLGGLSILVLIIIILVKISSSGWDYFLGRYIIKKKGDLYCN